MHSTTTATAAARTSRRRGDIPKFIKRDPHIFITTDERRSVAGHGQPKKSALGAHYLLLITFALRRDADNFTLPTSSISAFFHLPSHSSSHGLSSCTNGLSHLISFHFISSHLISCTLTIFVYSLTYAPHDLIMPASYYLTYILSALCIASAPTIIYFPFSFSLDFILILISRISARTHCICIHSLVPSLCVPLSCLGFIQTVCTYMGLDHPRACCVCVTFLPVSAPTLGWR